jgi:hypothetical protein
VVYPALLALSELVGISHAASPRRCVIPHSRSA